MGALAAAIWFGVGITVLGLVLPEERRAADKNASAKDSQQDCSWSTGRVLGSVAAALCFLEAAAHSGEVLASGYALLRSPPILKKVCSDLKTDLKPPRSQNISGVGGSNLFSNYIRRLDNV